MLLVLCSCWLVVVVVWVVVGFVELDVVVLLWLSLSVLLVDFLFLSGIFSSSFSFLFFSLGGLLLVAAFGGTTFPTSRILSSLFTFWMLRC